MILRGRSALGGWQGVGGFWRRGSRLHLRTPARLQREVGRSRGELARVTKFEYLLHPCGSPPRLCRLRSRATVHGRPHKLNKLDHRRTWCFSIPHWMGRRQRRSHQCFLPQGQLLASAPRQRSWRPAPHAVPSGGGGRREGGRRRSSSPVAFLMLPPGRSGSLHSPSFSRPGLLYRRRRRCYSESAEPTGEAARSKVARESPSSRRAPKGQGATGAESLRHKERGRMGPRMTRRRR